MKRTLLAVAALAFSSLAVAAQPAVPAKVVEAIGAAYSAKFNAKPSEINATPIPDVYQVVMAGSITYMDGTGRYAIEGQIVDTKTNTNLSTAKQNELTLKSVQALDVKDAIKIQHGDGSRIVYTFEDANCGFCKKLAPELDKLQNITIYTFPVMFLGPDSGEKARRVWCSPDKVGNWSKFMANQTVEATDTSCDTSLIERNGKVAGVLGVSGTPTLFFKDGSRIVGYREAAEIDDHFKTVQ